MDVMFHESRTFLEMEKDVMSVEASFNGRSGMA